MVVRPAAALLAAHLQATWNRSRKELGAFGRMVQAVLFLLIGLAGAAPLLALPLVAGFFLGRNIAGPRACLVLGATLGGMSLLGGVAGGVAGGSRVLAWAAARVFPVKVRDLFLAELIAGLGDVLPLALALASGSLLLGVAIACPRLVPLLPLPWLETVASLLCIQYLVNSLAARAVARLQVGLVLLALAAWVGTSLLPALEVRGMTPLGLIQRGGPALQALGSFALATPPLQALQGLRDAAQGRWGLALARQAYPAAALLLLLLAASWTLSRDADPQDLGSRRRPGKDRTWSFRTPARGVARLHWQTIISSHLGRFGFLIPLMLLVILKGPASLSRSSWFWSVPAAFTYLGFSGVQFQLNQFGLDGPGVKTLLLLPLRSRDILAGKALGLAAYMGAQTALLLAILAAAGLLGAAQVLPALCLSGCMFLYQVAFGHWTSAWLPRPMPRDSLRNNNVAPAVIWLGMAVTLVGAACFGGAFVLLAWLQPAWLLPVMALLLAGMATLYRQVLLPAAATYLDRRREVLVQALGRQG